MFLVGEVFLVGDVSRLVSEHQRGRAPDAQSRMELRENAIVSLLSVEIRLVGER